MKLTERIAGGLVTLGVIGAMTVLATNAFAQTQPGRAEVRSIKGSAVYSTPTSPAQPLKVGTVLPAGTTIRTSAGTSVDLFLGNSAGVVRLTENTTLTLDKLALTDTGADTVVEVQLNLPEGNILGNVNKLSAASKYEVKVPNGVAGIRGTRFRMSSTSFLVLLDGTLVFVHVPPGGQPTPYTLSAPPPVYFSPIEGVKLAPEDLVNEVRNQFTREGGGGGPDVVGPPPPSAPEPFVSPTTGADD